MGYIKAKNAVNKKQYEKERHVRVILIAPEGTYIDGEELLIPMEILVEMGKVEYDKSGGKIKIGQKVSIHDLINAYIEKVSKR